MSVYILYKLNLFLRPWKLPVSDRHLSKLVSDAVQNLEVCFGSNLYSTQCRHNRHV